MTEDLLNSDSWLDILKGIEWKEGKAYDLPRNTYRTQGRITCSYLGRQTADFANGRHNYFAYIGLVRPDGSPIMQGVNVVPVLPDGRILMVVEQRPAHFCFSDQPEEFLVNKGGEVKKVDLKQYGAYSTLEFPGGAVESTDSLKIAALRELIEETGIPEQPATLYSRGPKFFPQGADMALEMSQGVVFLNCSKFQDSVTNDGGLRIFALTPEIIRWNIQQGKIRSLQAALFGWYFYEEVTRFINKPDEFLAGYISSHSVSIKS